MVSRRESLKLLLLSASSLLGMSWLSACASPARRNSALEPGRKLYFYKADFSKPEPFMAIYGLFPNIKKGEPSKRWLCEYDLSNNSYREVEVPNLTAPHSILIDESRNRLVCFPKVGDETFVVELKSFRVLSSFKSKPGYYFYGHGSLSPDGRTISVSQAAKDGGGIVTVHDAETYRETKSLDSFGFAPHDLKYFDEATLVVANNGWSELNLTDKKPSTLVWLDPRNDKAKLIKKVDAPRAEFTLQHFAFEKVPSNEAAGANRRLFVGMDVPWKGDVPPVGLGLGAVVSDNSLHATTDSKVGIEHFHRNTLSVDGDSVSGAFLTTTPESSLALWDSKTFKLSAVVPKIQHPHGVNAALDQAAAKAGSSEVDYFVTTATMGIWKVVVARTGDGPIVKSALQIPGTEKFQNIFGHSSIRTSS